MTNGTFRLPKLWRAAVPRNNLKYLFLRGDGKHFLVRNWLNYVLCVYGNRTEIIRNLSIFFCCRVFFSYSSVGRRKERTNFIMLEKNIFLDFSQTTMKKNILRRLNVSLTEGEESHKLRSIVGTPLSFGHPSKVGAEANVFFSIKTTHEELAKWEENFFRFSLLSR